jgi:hypothetical protein
VVEVGSGTYALCSGATVSQGNEAAILGTSFFIDRFVQFDWDNEVLRVADITTCPNNTFNTVNTSTEVMSGTYSFPYTIESGSYPPHVGVFALLLCLIFFV